MIILFLVLFFSCSVHARTIIMRDTNSRLSLTNQSVFDVAYDGAPSYTTHMITGGILGTDFSSTISGRLYLNDVEFQENNLGFHLTCTYDAGYTGSFVLWSGGTVTAGYERTTSRFFNARGAGNRLDGFLSGRGTRLINPAAGSELLLGLRNFIVQDIPLNNATIELTSDAAFASGFLPTGEGELRLGGHTLSLGFTELEWPGVTHFYDGRTLVLGNNIQISGMWYFDQDAVVDGRNNVLDLSLGGSIVIAPGVSVELNNLSLLGIRANNILFQGADSQLALFGTTLQFDEACTFTQGGIYVNGPVLAITGANLVSFDQQASLTVDGTFLTYDPLSFNDLNNIRFGSFNANRTLLNGGGIRRDDALPLGDIIINQDVELDRSYLISDLRRLDVQTTAVIDGAGFALQCARTAQSPVIVYPADERVVFENILLQDYPIALADQPASTQLIFGDKTEIELVQSARLSTTWYIQGSVVLNGNKKIIEFAPGGNIILRPGATLSIDNLTLRGLRGSNIRCMDNTATLSCGAVQLIMDADYTLSRGNLTIAKHLDLKGTASFVFSSLGIIAIQNKATCKVSDGATLLYQQPTDHRHGIYFAGDDATLELNGGTLAATAYAPILRRGCISIQANGIMKDNAVLGDMLEDEYSIYLGSGLEADNISLLLGPAAVLDIQQGIVYYANTI